MSSVHLATAAKGSLQLDSAHRLILLMLWRGHTLHLQRNTRGQFDRNVLESTAVSAVPAEVVDAKTSVEESLLPLRHSSLCDHPGLRPIRKDR